MHFKGWSCVGERVLENRVFSSNRLVKFCSKLSVLFSVVCHSDNKSQCSSFVESLQQDPSQQSEIVA